MSQSTAQQRPEWCTCKEDYIPGVHTAHCLYRKRDSEGVINRCNINHDHSDDYRFEGNPMSNTAQHSLVSELDDLTRVIRSSLLKEIREKIEEMPESGWLEEKHKILELLKNMEEAD